MKSAMQRFGCSLQMTVWHVSMETNGMSLTPLLLQCFHLQCSEIRAFTDIRDFRVPCKPTKIWNVTCSKHSRMHPNQLSNIRFRRVPDSATFTQFSTDVIRFARILAILKPCNERLSDWNDEICWVTPKIKNQLVMQVIPLLRLRQCRILTPCSSPVRHQSFCAEVHRHKSKRSMRQHHQTWL